MKPIVYVMWGVCAGGFVLVAGPMLLWKWLEETIDEALAWV